MSHTRFDRHEHMSPETLDGIMDLIRDMKLDSERSFSLENSLFGLFDGFLYDDLLEDGKEVLSEEKYSRLVDIVDEVSEYPVGLTQV